MLILNSFKIINNAYLNFMAILSLIVLFTFSKFSKFNNFYLKNTKFI